MPTTPGTKGDTLSSQQVLEKVTGLITELSDDTEPMTETKEPESPAPTPSMPPPEDVDTESPVAETYEVKVDGETLAVDLDELKSGYSRDADYRRKTMALAEERRAVEAEAQTAQQERERYRQGLEQLEQALQQLQGEPDWPKLRTEVTSEEFLKRKADWELALVQRQRLKAEQDRVTALGQEEQQRQYRIYVQAEEDKLRAAVPEWTDLDKGKAEIATLRAFVKKEYGIPEAQVANAFTSAAAILLARDAFQYRALHREPTPAAKAKVSSIKTARPGTPERPRPNARQQALLEQTKSGRHRDAAKAIEAMLPD